MAARRTERARVQDHVREPHEKDYEREERFQRNPQGALSPGAATPAPSPPAKRRAVTTPAARKDR